MAEIEEQQSFDLGVKSTKPQKELVKKKEKDDGRRILTVKSPIYEIYGDDQKLLGSVSGKRGCWVLPHGKAIDLISIEALQEIPLHNGIVIDTGAVVYTYPKRLINPNKS